MAEFVTGGIFKKYDPNVIARLIAWDFRRLFNDLHRAKHDEKLYINDIEKKHALLEADQDFQKYRKWMEKADTYSYKIGMREFVLLKGMLVNLKVFLASQNKVSRASSAYLQQIEKILEKKEGKESALLKFFKDVEVKEKEGMKEFNSEVEATLTDVKNDLVSLRQAVHSIEKRAEVGEAGQAQLKFLLKKEHVSRWRLFPLRFRSRHQRVQLRQMSKDEESQHGLDLLFMQHLKNTLDRKSV